MLEDALHRERAQGRDAAQFFQAYAAIEVGFEVFPDLLQGIGARGGRFAATAWPEAGGLGVRWAREEADVLTQGTAAGAGGAAEHARGQHGIEDLRLRVAGEDLRPGGFGVDDGLCGLEWRVHAFMLTPFAAAYTPILAFNSDCSGEWVVGSG
jgi:hypothetical protein